MEGFQVYADIDPRRLISFPTNSISGPLQIYYDQWLERSTAPFIAEIQDYRIVLRLRLQNFINMNLTKRYHFQNITFNCYNESNYSTVPVLTIHISISLYPRINVVAKVLRSSSISSEIHRIKNASLQELLFPLPLLLSENTSYKFSYQTNEKHATLLQWPAWPLPRQCINKCSHTIKNKRNQSSPCLKCLRTNTLKVIAPHKLFSSEKTALSSWLDLQYEVSKYSSMVSYRRMHPFERASKRSVCSSQFHDWTSKYHRWHSEIARQISGYNLTFAEQREIILKLDIRFIVVKTFGSGLADRIAHLIATYLIAMLTQRFLLLDDTWSEFHEIMRSSLAYRSEAIAPWLSRLDKLNSNFGFDFQRFFTSKLETAGVARLYRDFDYHKEYPERVLLIRSHVGNVVHTVTSPSSVYAPLLNEKLHMEADNLFGCLYHSLVVPRLSMLIEVCSAVNESMQYFLQSLMFSQHPTIGIQIRAGDSYMNENKPYLFNSSNILANFSAYFDCAQNLTNGHTASLVYLMSDSVNLRLAALARWPFPGNDTKQIQVIASSDPAKHIKYTSNPLVAFRTAVFETFLFSLCDTHIITTDSGFGRFVAFASLRRRPFYSFNPWEHPYCAIGEGQVTFMRAGHQWSGV